MPECGGLSGVVDHVLPVMASLAVLLRADPAAADGIRLAPGRDDVNLKCQAVSSKRSREGAVLTSMAAFCRFDWEKLNVKTSFQTGFFGSPDLPVLLFFFFTRLPLIIRYNCVGRSDFGHSASLPSAGRFQRLTFTYGSWVVSKFFAFIMTIVRRSAWGR